MNVYVYGGEKGRERDYYTCEENADDDDDERISKSPAMTNMIYPLGKLQGITHPI